MPTTHIRGQLSVRHSSIPLMLLLATTAMPAFAQTEPATPSQDAAVSDTADQAGGSTAADANAAPAQQNGLENIVVTATKRETNLQKTPIAISVNATPTIIKPAGSVHNTVRKPGFTKLIIKAVANGRLERIQADMRPSAESTRILPSSSSLARISPLIFSSNSARLPPLSRWISTAITK